MSKPSALCAIRHTDLNPIKGPIDPIFMFLSINLLKLEVILDSYTFSHATFTLCFPKEYWYWNDMWHLINQSFWRVSTLVQFKFTFGEGNCRV